MLVPDARVTHLISQTIGGTAIADDPKASGELTWAMVRLFEKKYGVRKFESDARYRGWKRHHPE
jgi:hypothetical protein